MDNRHDAFLMLFLRHQSALYAFIIARGVHPDNAEDVLQNVAGVLWSKFDSYQENTNFKAWAFAVTRIEIGRYRDRQKRDGRVLYLDEETLQNLDTLEEGGHEDVIDFQVKMLRKCVGRLGGDARNLIQLRYGDGLPFEEMVRVTRKSSGALRIQMSRIRRSLLECVKSQMQEVEA